MSDLLAAVDWPAASAVVQALASVAIVGLTVAYVVATGRIRKANDEMARANEAMVAEMRRDREHARHERSAGAAQQMTAATMRLMFEWRRAVDDPTNVVFPISPERPGGQPLVADDKRRRAFADWQEAYRTQRADISSETLVDDLDRFGRIVTTALTDWDAISIAGDDGDPSHPPRRRPDYRAHRLGWCQRRLIDALDAHRRGDDLDSHALPRDTGKLLSLPVGSGEDEFATLVDD